MSQAWEGSDRRARLPRNWATLRRSVMQRAGWQCEWMRADTGQRCPEVASDCDHVIPGDDHSPSNLQALCGYHHGVKSGRDGGLAAAASRKPGGRYSRLRKPPEHPGYVA